MVPGKTGSMIFCQVQKMANTNVFESERKNKMSWPFKYQQHWYEGMSLLEDGMNKALTHTFLGLFSCPQSNTFLICHSENLQTETWLSFEEFWWTHHIPSDIKGTQRVSTRFGSISVHYYDWNRNEIAACQIAQVKIFLCIGHL